MEPETKTFCTFCNEEIEITNSHVVMINVDNVNIDCTELCSDCCEKFKDVVRTGGLTDVLRAYLN